MKMVFEDVKVLMDGVWVAKADGAELKGFATRPPSAGHRSVVSVSGSRYDEEKNVLTVPPRGIEVLSVGSTNIVLIVEQSASSAKSPEEDKTSTCSKLKSQKCDYDGFLAACRNEGLPDTLVDLVGSILEEMGQTIQFSLSEGKARKWTADPNFVAITIQNRNQQLLISVKGEHSKLNYKTIEAVRGRGDSYSEFHLYSPHQREEALDAIQKSAGY